MGNNIEKPPIVELQSRPSLSFSFASLEFAIKQAKEDGKLDLRNQGVEDWLKEVHQRLVDHTVFKLITIVNLSNNRLVKIPPEFCDSLNSTLIELNLSNNRLEELPEEILKVKKTKNKY